MKAFIKTGMVILKMELKHTDQTIRRIVEPDARPCVRGTVWFLDLAAVTWSRSFRWRVSNCTWQGTVWIDGPSQFEFDPPLRDVKGRPARLLNKRALTGRLRRLARKLFT